MRIGEKDALLAHLELNLLILLDAHVLAKHIKKEAVDSMIEDVYDILNDLDEVVSVTPS